MIFVDTGAWFASITPWDANHAAATDWLRKNQQPLFTTDYILDETLTLLRIRKERARALAFGERLMGQELAQLYFLQALDIQEAWRIFRDFVDKDWSFTDCTSKIVIDALGISTAFSFDQHFRQFGTVQVVP